MESKLDNIAGREAGPSALAGRYLTFALADENYAVDILQVVEIISVIQITDVPRSPNYLKGVINLRGKIIPVIDLRLKFSMDPLEAYDDKTCIIVVNTRLNGEAIQLGVIVDTVLEVTQLLPEHISDAPVYGAKFDSHFILGMGKLPDREVIVLVDIPRVLSSEDAQLISEIAEGEV